MKYRSTRGGSQGLTFEEAVLQGLSPDGGLYVPQSIPKLTHTELARLSGLSFAQLAEAIFRLFIDSSEISDTELAAIAAASFSTFSDPDVVTPVVSLPCLRPADQNSAAATSSTSPNSSIQSSAIHPDPSQPGSADKLWLLELFHGPTLAFKDVALQVLGNLFDLFLRRKNAASQSRNLHRITVVGATSGDTGGAAIYGLRNKPNIQVFILHPYKRISSIQEQQMTSVLDANVHNIAVDGSFDDCQDIVKALFSDERFRTTHHLAAINSINWARILAQITYYFYSFFSVMKKSLPDTVLTAEHFDHCLSSPLQPRIAIQYSVPTGNFGDILAGFYARSMGLPIDKLIIATNENDILHRFLETGSYSKPVQNSPQRHQSLATQVDLVRQTLSPAMDILVSSNFERLLWYLVGLEDQPNGLDAHDLLFHDPHRADDASAKVKHLMTLLKTQGGFSVSDRVLGHARSLFASHRVDDRQVSNTIHRYFHQRFASGHDLPQNGMVLDPHTAVGIVAAEYHIARQQQHQRQQEQGHTQSSPVQRHSICLATASPGKFPEAVLDAIHTDIPQSSIDAGFVKLEFKDFAQKPLRDLVGLPTKCIRVSNGINGVRHVIQHTMTSIDTLARL
eukprot:jgi/Hompol1/1535/HPOL_004770-RA